MIRSASKNMCSVRHRPIPSAPNSRARLLSAGESALVRTPAYGTCRPTPSAWRSRPTASALGFRPIRAITSPVVPSRLIVSLPAEGPAADGDLLGLLVDLDFAGTGDAALAPTASDDRGVAGHPAGAGQNPGRACMPSTSSGLVSLADQITFSPASALFGFFGRERQLADRGTRAKLAGPWPARRQRCERSA
jgi:hypothetical protein